MSECCKKLGTYYRCGQKGHKLKECLYLYNHQGNQKKATELGTKISASKSSTEVSTIESATRIANKGINRTNGIGISGICHKGKIRIEEEITKTEIMGGHKQMRKHSQ